ncbi:hypothetical protein CHS0354_007797 [Potamilus streckersoni]|uniref:BTB domain-containing protein n=1 Tax=Potamilus streckersoni TaxID=2493646 RepID=A0AAE0WCF3_9BIVA|nr:hypothetical protein CHS0354_007797 [Potamilus streckersoni]
MEKEKDKGNSKDQPQTARNHRSSDGNKTGSANRSQNQSPTASNASSAANTVTHSTSPAVNNEIISRERYEGISSSANNSVFSNGASNQISLQGLCISQISLSTLIVPVNSAPTPASSLQAQGNSPAPFNWQATKTGVKERLAYLFNTDIMSDIHFLVGKEPNTQMIPAHKFVLSVGSAVFDAQFNGAMATKDSTIEIPDVEPAAFLALLKFLYSDEVQIGPETVMTTLYTAKKYAVPALEKACVEFLKKNLSSDNAFMLLTQARLFDEPQLAALCLETIDKNTSEALAADGFTDIDHETLCVVLERDTLGIRECKLFSAVCRWSEAECGRRNIHPTPENQRHVLGRVLRLIRFPLMSIEEFAIGAAQSGILEDREVVQLFLYFTVNPKPSINFQDVPRCCLTGKEQVVSRFCQIESRWGYSGTSDRIRGITCGRFCGHHQT